MNHRTVAVLLLVLVLFAAAGCANGPSEQDTETAQALAQALTLTAAPTATPSATPTKTPTPTFTSTPTPVPPTETPTPTPTETPIPPTDTPTPTPTETDTPTPTWTPTPTTGRITGKVYRSDTGEKLDYATICLTRPREEPLPPEEYPDRCMATAEANKNGRFTIAGLEPGTYSLSVTLHLEVIWEREHRNPWWSSPCGNGASPVNFFELDDQVVLAMLVSTQRHGVILLVSSLSVPVSAGQDTVLDLDLCCN